MTGLYVHIPFCVRKCAYCDFYSLPVWTGLIESYVDAVLAECETYTGLAFRTLFLGGGTPSLLGGARLLALTDALRRRVAFAPDAEVSIELDPRHVDGEMVDSLAAAGVTRVSLGVQDFTPKVQEAIGRIQPFEKWSHTRLVHGGALGAGAATATRLQGSPSR